MERFIFQVHGLNDSELKKKRKEKLKIKLKFGVIIALRSPYLYSALKISKRALSELRSRIAIEDVTNRIISLTNLLQDAFTKSAASKNLFLNILTFT